MKIRPVGAELFHLARQTDMMKLTVANNSVSKVTRLKTARMLRYSQRGHTISLRHSVKCCSGVHLYSYLIENGDISQGFKYPKCELSLQFSSHVFRTPFINIDTLPHSVTYLQIVTTD